MDADSVIDEAGRRLRAGDLAGAEQACGSVLAAEPEHADALHVLGQIAFAGGHYGEAVDLIRRACNAGAEVPVFMINLAFAL